MKSIIKNLIIASVLTIGTGFSAFAENGKFEQTLSEFEKSSGGQRVTHANTLMSILNDMEFTEAPVVFALNTPADSINQQIYYWAAEYFYDCQDYNRAIIYGEKALPLCRKQAIESDCLNLLSLAYFRIADYNHAATYAKQCYALDAKTGDPDIMSSSLNSLAGIYLGANQLDVARDYITQAITVAGQADNPARLAVLHATASEIYHASNDDDKALVHINKACEIEQKSGNSPRLNMRLVQKASVLNGLKRFAEAEKLLKQVIPALKETGDEHSLATAYNKLGMALRSQKREREAIPFFRLAAGIFSRQGDLAGEMHARRGLYESLWDINPDSAKIELDRFDLLKDSLYSHASAQSLARYRAEFDNDRLATENERQSRLTLYISAGLILLAIFVAALVWWLMRKRMRMREDALKAIIDALSEDKSETPAAPEEAKANTDVSKNDSKLLLQVVNVVKEAMSNQEHIDVETVASKLFLTRGHLNRRIKALTGVTTQQYINRVRLEYARQLLDNDTVSTIAEVGYQCGFDDASSFTRAFRNTFGTSPSAYRNRQDKDL